MHLVYLPTPSPTPHRRKKNKKFITIVFDFFCDDCDTQEKLKTMLSKNIGGLTRCFTVCEKMVNLGESREFTRETHAKRDECQSLTAHFACHNWKACSQAQLKEQCHSGLVHLFLMPMTRVLSQFVMIIALCNTCRNL